MKSKILISLFCLSVFSGKLHAQEKPFSLKEGDCVVFYGDSITDQRLYTTFAETFVVTRFPKLQVKFVHSGWGGDRVGGGGGGPIDLRLQRDVFAYHPNVMTIMLGMNDGSYRAFDDKIFEQYAKGYQHIIESVKKTLPGIRLTLIEPSPFDDVAQPPRFAGGYNSVLVRYGQFVKELAEREHLQVADLNTPIVAALEKAKATDAELVKKIIPDRVHPGPSGHLLMAAELLKSWNAPSIVTSVEIDGSGKITQKSTKVSGYRSDGKVTWTQMDEALPMPVDLADPVMALAVNSSDFVKSLDQQNLRVSGLSAPKYELKIDETQVGTFTKEQLAEGVNLATIPTPMARQAAEVHRLTLQHNAIHFARWRQIQVPMATYKSDKVHRAAAELSSALDEEENDVVKQQRSAAQPKEHRYELTPL